MSNPFLDAFTTATRPHTLDDSTSLDLDLELDELIDGLDVPDGGDDAVGLVPLPWTSDAIQHIQQGDPQWWPDAYRLWEGEHTDEDLIDLDADLTDEDEAEALAESVETGPGPDQYGFVFLPLVAVAALAVGKKLGRKGKDQILQAMSHFSNKRLRKIARSPFRSKRVKNAAITELMARARGERQRVDPRSWPGGTTQPSGEEYDVEYERGPAPAAGPAWRPAFRPVAPPPRWAPPPRRPVKHLYRAPRAKDARDFAPRKEAAFEHQREVQARAAARRERIEEAARHHMVRPTPAIRVMPRPVTPLAALAQSKPMVASPKFTPQSRYVRTPVPVPTMKSIASRYGEEAAEAPSFTSGVWNHPFQYALVLGTAYGVGAVIGGERTAELFQGLWKFVSSPFRSKEEPVY